jgi:hypothetical protein
MATSYISKKTTTEGKFEDFGTLLKISLEKLVFWLFRVGWQNVQFMMAQRY